MSFGLQVFIYDNSNLKYYSSKGIEFFKETLRYGYCHIFAIAAAQYLPLKIVGWTENRGGCTGLVHICLELPNQGGFFDSRGIVDYETLKADYALHDHFHNFSEFTIDELWGILYSPFKFRDKVLNTQCFKLVDQLLKEHYAEDFKQIQSMLHTSSSTV